MKCKGIFVFLFLFSFTFFLSLLAQDQKPVEPINWRELIPFLGEISGWEAEADPEGSSVSMEKFKISQAERDYTAEDKTLTILIVDGGYVPMVYSAFKTAISFEIDTSEEYVKKVTIKGFPGVEQYEYEDKEAEIMILISERFLVHLRGENMKDTSELKAIADNLDLEGLAKLAK